MKEKEFYKKRIIDMVHLIEDQRNISMLYGVVKTMVEYEEKKEERGD